MERDLLDFSPLEGKTANYSTVVESLEVFSNTEGTQSFHCHASRFQDFVPMDDEFRLRLTKFVTRIVVDAATFLMECYDEVFCHDHAFVAFFIYDFIRHDHFALSHKFLAILCTQLDSSYFVVFIFVSETHDQVWIS